MEHQDAHAGIITLDAKGKYSFNRGNCTLFQLKDTDVCSTYGAGLFSTCSSQVRSYAASLYTKSLNVRLGLMVLALTPALIQGPHMTGAGRHVF